jgi:hypothetical protein
MADAMADGAAMTEGGAMTDGGAMADGSDAVHVTEGAPPDGMNASPNTSDAGLTADASFDANDTDGWTDASSDASDAVDGALSDGPPGADSPPMTVELDIARSGSGSGKVVASSNAGTIECPVSCAKLFEVGSVVTLSAFADAGSLFAGWSGGACAGLSPCTLTTTSPQSVTARFFHPVRLSDVDKSPTVTLSADRLGMQQFTLGREGVRSDTAIAPGSGVFYFEVMRHVEARYMVYGVATSAVPLDSQVDDTDQAFDIDSGDAALFDPVATSHYGFVVDYRQAHPIVYLIALSNGQPGISKSSTLSQVTEPLYIFVGGLRRNVGIQASVNTGNDIVNFPFAYDPRALLQAAGISGADQVVLGWGDSYSGIYNSLPSLTVSADQNVSLGSPVTVTAGGIDAEDGDMTAKIAWTDLAMPFGQRTTGTGGSFTLTPNALGLHELQATITDSGNKVAMASVRITVNGALPAWSPVHLQPDAMSGSGIVLTPDGLGARYTGAGKMGIRANQGLLHGFRYFEIHREIAPTNMGGGLVIQDGNLNPYGPGDVPPSCSMNVLGATWRDLMFGTSFPPNFATAESYYGFAVDYRGTFPVVYVIVGGDIVDIINMTDVTVPVYPMLYGNPTGQLSGSDETINFGTKPFHYDPVTILNHAGIDISQLQVSWGP